MTSTHLFHVVAEGSPIGQLRSTPETVWWAHLVPFAAAGVIAFAVAATILFLPKILKGGLGGPALLKTLFDNSETAAANAATAPSTAPSASKLEPLPETGGASPEAAKVVPAGAQPTWVGLDLSIFDEDDTPAS
jgi:hypothetical protein